MLDQQSKKLIRKLFRVWSDERRDHLAERAALKAHIEACTEDGKIAINRSGMDCDCSQYASTRHIPAPLSVFAFVVEEDKHCESLDGPESMWIGKPSEYPARYASVDRALEAYEDGHPSVVYWGDL